uniref:Plastocyanin-like domain-containing protein n=1 Tax=Ananas comosus var. bracteatus TaxID=296719 RepID=A0A6V7P7T4_ANACO|nr:unnamed protein product [Ananas comosus var. bracteatus]
MAPPAAPSPRPQHRPLRPLLRPRGPHSGTQGLGPSPQIQGPIPSGHPHILLHNGYEIAVICSNDADITAEKGSTVKKRSMRVPKKEHKAKREKMKRDHMNELFLELSHAIGFVLLFGALASPAWTKVHHHTFVIEETNYTRLCHTKSILTVNGQFPGPTINARNGDTVVVKVYNHAGYNITLHWHGVHETRNPWSDGTEYITQCPIQPGGNFTQRIDLTEEEGTLWWHAHSDWDRATLYGAIVIHPMRGTSFPFPKPHKEIPILLGEWWIANVSQILADLIQTGGNPNISDAYTINGQPGISIHAPKKIPSKS